MEAEEVKEVEQTNPGLQLDNERQTQSTALLHKYYVATSYKKIENEESVLGICILSEMDPYNMYTKILRDSKYTTHSLELLAILECLNLYISSTCIHIYSRSLCVVNCINLWSKKWREKDWIKQSNKNPIGTDTLKHILNKLSSLEEDGIQVFISYISKADKNLFSKNAHNYISTEVKSHMNNMIND